MTMRHPFRNTDKVEAKPYAIHAGDKPKVGVIVQAPTHDNLVEVYFKDEMKAAWFHFDQLTLIEKGSVRLDEERKQAETVKHVGELLY